MIRLSLQPKCVKIDHDDAPLTSALRSDIYLQLAVADLASVKNAFDYKYMFISFCVQLNNVIRLGIA